MAKKTLTGEIEAAAHEAWHDFARDHNTSVAKLLEVIGENIDVVLDDKRTHGVLVEANRRTFDGNRAGGPKPRKRRS